MSRKLKTYDHERLDELAVDENALTMCNEYAREIEMGRGHPPHVGDEGYPSLRVRESDDAERHRYEVEH